MTKPRTLSLAAAYKRAKTAKRVESITAIYATLLDRHRVSESAVRGWLSGRRVASIGQTLSLCKIMGVSDRDTLAVLRDSTRGAALCALLDHAGIDRAIQPHHIRAVYSQ